MASQNFEKCSQVECSCGLQKPIMANWFSYFVFVLVDGSGWFLINMKSVTKHLFIFSCNSTLQGGPLVSPLAWNVSQHYSLCFNSYKMVWSKLWSTFSSTFSNMKFQMKFRNARFSPTLCRWMICISAILGPIFMIFVSSEREKWALVNSGEDRGSWAGGHYVPFRNTWKLFCVPLIVIWP